MWRGGGGDEAGQQPLLQETKFVEPLRDAFPDCDHAPDLCPMGARALLITNNEVELTQELLACHSPGKDRFDIGPRCIIANDVDLRGDITIGAGCVLHPRATIVAVSGPIVLGTNNIVEEQAIIVNRSKIVMEIGNDNHFQVGSRVESPKVGSHNVFDIKSRTTFNVSVGSHCHIGPGCVVLPSPFPPAFVAGGPRSPVPPPLPPKDIAEEDGAASPGSDPRASTSAAPSPLPDTGTGDTDPTVETLGDYTQIYSSDNKRRAWSGEGSAQLKALHAKHLVYLRETLPRYNKLKTFT
ncbi:hypothetical protein ACM66B_003826 [Microbotryomycetes sp. NB124-2]